MTFTKLLLASTALSLAAAAAATAQEGRNSFEPLLMAQAVPAEGSVRERRQELRQERQEERQERRQERAGEQRRENPQQQRRENVQERRENLQQEQRRENVQERRENLQEQRRENVQERRENLQEQRRENVQERRENLQEQRRENVQERRENQQERAEDRRELRQDRAEDRQDFRRGRVVDIQRGRRERVESGGGRTIIEEPGNRVIVREGNRVVIRHDETDRFRRAYRGTEIRTERRGAEVLTVVSRPGGVEIVTVRDADGDLLRRVRRVRGVETVLIQNVVRGGARRRFGFVDTVIELPPPRISIPREKYVVEVERASEADLVETFAAPPVEPIERAYTLDEVRQSRSLRERVRRVDIDTLTFEFGSWELPEDQVGALTGVATAIRRALDKNPDEIFLIEGHTDAVGPDVDNLTLSDRRAEAIADALTDRFEIPAENLTTQGYGEQYLKVATEGEERGNRRVTVRRITPLLKGGGEG